MKKGEEMIAVKVLDHETKKLVSYGNAVYLGKYHVINEFGRPTIKKEPLFKIPGGHIISEREAILVDGEQFKKMGRRAEQIVFCKYTKRTYTAVDNEGEKIEL